MDDGWRGKPKEFETSGEPRPLVELVGYTTMVGEDVDSLDDATLPDRRKEKASIPVGDPGAQPWSVVREPWNHEVRLLLPHSGSENPRKRQPASVEGKIMMDAVDDVAEVVAGDATRLRGRVTGSDVLQSLASKCCQ